jgi:hypothetical protein
MAVTWYLRYGAGTRFLAASIAGFAFKTASGTRASIKSLTTTEIGANPPRRS